MRRLLFGLLVGVGICLVSAPALAQTPDATTPAEEETCVKYKTEGARLGLCIAYCEAQDCDITKPYNPSCASIAERFIAYSVKKGYVKAPMDGPAISCNVTACSKDDAAYCGGVERDCAGKDGVCQSVCSSRLIGFGEKGEPICSMTPVCEKCVPADPNK